jgi:tRNA (cmo5U34)-methyltransferase
MDSKESTHLKENGEPEGQRDRVFQEPQAVADFTFGEKVASVFDDMLDRSVPFYQEIQRMITDFAADFAVDNTAIYDLGCSTGTTLLNLDAVVPPGVQFVGVDSSEQMLKRCREKFEASSLHRSYDLVQADLNQGVPIRNASMVLMVLTLQFVRPL